MPRPSALTVAARVRAQLLSGEARRIWTAAGFSDADVARELKLSRATVTDWANRKRQPTVEHAVALGKLLADLDQKAA